MPRLGTAAPDDLKLDLQNPRIPDASFKTEDEALEYLFAQADLGELIQSIGNSGWLDFEPLIVEEASMIVVEGNRRLAALRILANPALQQRLRAVVPDPLHANAQPQLVQVNFVESRKEARDFIGFKHVNGAFKWDSYAKARFAHAWLEDGDSIDEVSRRLGDGHNTISRLVNGVVVLAQAESSRLFDKEQRTKKSFYFSHLYTALSTPNVRQYLGLPDNDNSVLGKDPVPADRRANLKSLLSWLYGQDDEPSVIKSQNPDLGHLVSVLGNERATSSLTASRNLDRSYEMIEDKALAFEKAFYKLADSVREVSGVVAQYDPKSEFVDEAVTLQRAINIIVQSIKAAHTSGDASDEA